MENKCIRGLDRLTEINLLGYDLNNLVESKRVLTFVLTIVRVSLRD